MAIEIVIQRDPDDGTYLWYFRDGVLMRAEDLNITEYTVDPGRSGGDAEWVKGMNETAQSASPVARAYIKSMVTSYSK
ncbi:hypothetical protein ACIQPR_43560 [Streptomyces sp. NPDC091280]|uniref:hypothetical protein n=1 Tax=Streptomyces sp. NPDC091280 TaxID=3365984 RepID=UPI003815EE6F